MKRRVFWLMLILLATRLDARTDEPVFSKLNTNHGLSHNTVYTITQDHKGFMWLGTREGLNRYDGTSILTFYADPLDSSKLFSNHITALETGSDGTLYVGTPQGVHVYDHSRGVFTRIYFQGAHAGYINGIQKTSEGNILVCSSRGLFMLRPGHTDLQQIIEKANVLDAVEFKRGIFWISTLQNILMINEHGELIRVYTTLHDRANRLVSLNNNIFCLFKDSFGDIWLGSKKNGLFKYDLKEDAFSPVVTQFQFNPLEVNVIRVIAEDSDKKLWIGTESGLFIYNRAQQVFQYFTQSFDQSSTSLSDKAIYAIYKSREGIMWIGTYFGGVNIARPREKGFKSLMADGGYKKLNGKAVSDIIQDSKGKLWLATEDGGVSIWDRKTDVITYLKNESGKKSLSVNNVHSLYEDVNGVFWIGTFLGGLNKYDSKNQTITVYKKNQEETSSFPDNMIYAVHKDRTGELWIGTQAGLSKFNHTEGTYEPFMPKTFRGKFIYDIYEERSGALWICANNADTLYYYNPATSQLEKHRYHDAASPGNPGFICALEDSNGQIWFGTINHGLVRFDRSAKTFSAFTTEQGLSNNYVYGILEDSQHNLWMSTNKGLSKFNPKTQRFTNYDISHGLPNNQFNFKSAFKDGDGWMYFGTINGLCYFHPDSLMINEAAPTVYLSDFKLFNKSISASADGLLQKDIDATNKVTVRYDDNMITIEFGAVNYYASGSNQYAYFLEGFDQGWNYVGKKSNAIYTNLSPGDYVFKVKAANNDGIWSNDVKELHVTVLPPFWLSSWAILFYGVLVIAMFVAYRTFLNYRNKEKMAVQLERMEKEKINEINQHKLNFFTYISHEFKTPLTLIMASIDKFLQEKSLNEDQSAGYWSIRRSAKRLHFLIEQLMEFRRVETDHEQIQFAKGDIVMFLRDTFMAFSPLFHKKKINFYFNSDITVFNCFFDADKLEKIITNLVSNAVKYTHESGLIEMEARIKINEGDQPDSITIVIDDTGSGMGQEELANVFTVFYQTESAKKSGSGTGIGLALVKSLVDFLGGSIEIQSRKESGTHVTLTLPLLKQVSNDRVPVVDGNRSIDIEHVLPVDYKGDGVTVEGNAHPGYQLMIVEDSEELISFLGAHFDKNFKITKAANGAVALEKIKKSAPDIIISDVMMPEMDGIELCQAVKADLSTSHIPVVLLTAKTTVENRLAGLDAGADAYIPKPFSLKELDLVIKNLLSTQDKLKTHFLKFGSLKEMEVSFTNRDQDFILKLTQIVEKHIDDAGFNITVFAEEACVSRSLLHLKLKKLVNLSASEFIRHIRLQKAADLLRTTDNTITEIAYKVGYSDANYFSRSFKEQYQVNPTEFKQSPVPAK
jgi:ligand-binding sensor domain-containing protein/signal transduction histidine kinase/CheY-like chemotaxis protein